MTPAGDAAEAALDAQLEAFNYVLPSELIAQHPCPDRDGARLLVLPRTASDSAIEHSHVRELPRWLRAGDLLVVNATRVLPARLEGRKQTGAPAEALVLGRAEGENCYRALVKARGKLRVGAGFEFGPPGASIRAQIASLGERGELVLEFALGEHESPYSVGLPPLPPYILKARRDAAADGETTSSESVCDAERYQTVFAKVPGSVAAPTAGLHLTFELLAQLTAAGVEHAEVVLHVGPGTFRPLSAEDLARGRLHQEPFELPTETADAVARTRARGGRVVAVGTTSVRVLEACASEGGGVQAGRGETDLFLRPGSAFRVVDALLTNFHLPGSSLLLLAAAFAGRERLLGAYEQAVRRGYRFYSYGDAMLIV